MRAAAVLTILIAAVTLTTAADAQTRRRSTMIIDVTPRSFLDAGRTVPVGTYSSYVYDQTPFSVGTERGRGLFSDLNLPDRFSAGRPVTVDFRAPDFLRK